MPHDHDQLPQSEPTTVKTILVVEDDGGIGSFLSLAIAEETPFQAVVVTTGEQALETVSHVPVDLLLLDYTLPTINGIELYDQLHAMPGLETLPAILFTASLAKHQNVIAQRQMIGLGKPIELDELLETLRMLLA
jgi:DNA-binding response OmpR family regulator